MIREHVSTAMPALIKKLNATLRGWANDHRHVVASEAFSKIDTYVYEKLWHIVRRRHPQKSAGWLTKHYWTAAGKGIFMRPGQDRKGQDNNLSGHANHRHGDSPNGTTPGLFR